MLEVSFLVGRCFFVDGWAIKWPFNYIPKTPKLFSFLSIYQMCAINDLSFAVVVFLLSEKIDPSRSFFCNSCLYKKKSCSFSSTKQFDFCRFIIISSKNYIRFETKKNIIIHRLGAGQCILFHILYIYIFRYCHCEPISICCIHDVMCVSSMLIIGLNVY